MNKTRVRHGAANTPDRQSLTTAPPMPFFYVTLIFARHNKKTFVSFHIQNDNAMSQVSVTVTMDSRMKEQIDQFCALSGNTQEQTFDEMMRMWERIVFVPWTEFSRKERARQKGMAAFNRIREMAEEGDLPEMTLDEINAEIAAARAERHAREDRQ